MNFENIELLTNDLAGKDERTNINISIDNIKSYDLITINQVNDILEFYNDEVNDLNKIADGFENNSLIALVKQLDPTINEEKIILETYKSIVAKSLADLKLIQIIGWNICSTTVMKNLNCIIRFLNNKLNEME